jgi:DNA-binding NtrC family response regulator
MKERFDGLVDYLFTAKVPLPQAIEVLERAMIDRAMTDTGGNQCAASKRLGIHRNTLQRKIVVYGVADGRRPRRKPVARQGRARKRRAGAA